MLYDSEGKLVGKIPLEADFESCRARIADETFRAIVSKVNQLADERDGFKSTWLVDPISAEEHAQLREATLTPEGGQRFFCQIVWHVLRNHKDEWYFHGQTEAIEPTETYFFRRTRSRAPVT